MRNVGLARAAVEKMRALLENANLQKQRADELIKTNAISQATRDDRNASAREAEGNFAAADADLKTAEINLAYTDISSPIDGRIGRTAVTRGNVVGPNSGVLTTIVSETPGSKLAKLYAPASLLTTVATTPVALFVAVISTPGKTAPDASFTVPVIEAWANAAAGTSTSNARTAKPSRNLRMNYLPSSSV